MTLQTAFYDLMAWSQTEQAIAAVRLLENRIENEAAEREEMAVRLTRLMTAQQNMVRFQLKFDVHIRQL